MPTGKPRQQSKSIKHDQKTVDAAGRAVGALPHGVSFRSATTHFDDRGSVCELLDERWEWSKAPMVFSYMFTLRPNKVKGWAMHMEHEDRYIVLLGEMQLVLYDDRARSPTRGLVATVHMSEWNRGLLNIPIGIWHAVFNPGSRDAVTINFPTEPYNHDKPDKYRLPFDTGEIPYKFPPNAEGW